MGTHCSRPHEWVTVEWETDTVLELRVANCGGHLCTVFLEGASTVEDLKAAVEASTGVAAAAQRLHFGSRELLGHHALASLLLGYTRKQELLLVRRPEEQVTWLQEVGRTKSFKVCDWLRAAPVEAAQDQQAILAAVSKNWRALEFAGDELKADRKVVLTAIATNWQALQFAADELKADREVVLAAMAQNVLALEFAAAELQTDREVVFLAIAKDCRALEFAAHELKIDREVVLAAIAKDPLALRWAPAELKADREVVLAAVAMDCRALKFAAAELKTDREVIHAIIAKDVWA